MIVSSIRLLRVLTRRAVPWCRLEAPVKVISVVCLHCFWRQFSLLVVTPHHTPGVMSFTFRQGDLPKLDLQVDRGSDFKAWQTQWESYMSLSGLEKESAAKQV